MTFNGFLFISFSNMPENIIKIQTSAVCTCRLVLNMYRFKLAIGYFKASCGTREQSVTVNRLVVGSIPLEEMKYLLKFIFPFLRSGVEAKCGVEFCHSTRYASRIWQKVGKGLS